MQHRAERLKVYIETFDMRNNKPALPLLLSLLCVPGAVMFIKALVAPDSEWSVPIGICLMLTNLAVVVVPAMIRWLFIKRHRFALAVEFILIAGISVTAVNDILSTNAYGRFFAVARFCVYILVITLVVFFAAWKSYDKEVPTTGNE